MQDSPLLGEGAPRRGEYVKDTETQLVVCVGLYQWNGRGSWDGSRSRHVQKQKLSCFQFLRVKLLLV